MKVKTNNVPRDIVEAHELTVAERAEFDYLDWPALERGEDSHSFVRYRGDPTWAVNLWLSNDEGLYLDAQDFARQYPDRTDLADVLKVWVRGLVEPDEASLRSDLLGHALDSVDWFEIADAWLED